MKKSRVAPLALGLGLLLTMVIGGVALAGGVVTDPDALEEVAQARQATRQYHDVSPAMAAGYLPISGYVPQMGIHYVNFGLVDGTFDATRPEVLLYAPSGPNGRRLVGIEYIVAGPEPEGFSGDSDHWELHLGACHYTDGSESLCPTPAHADPDKTLVFWHPDLWLLHVWAWQANPDGLFEHLNAYLP